MRFNKSGTHFGPRAIEGLLPNGPASVIKYIEGQSSCGKTLRTAMVVPSGTIHADTSATSLQVPTDNPNCVMRFEKL